jgi:hypothetical protein
MKRMLLISFLFLSSSVTNGQNFGLYVLYWRDFALRLGFQINKEGDSRKYRIENANSIDGSEIVYITIFSWKAWYGEPALAANPYC